MRQNGQSDAASPSSGVGIGVDGPQTRLPDPSCAWKHPAKGAFAFRAQTLGLCNTGPMVYAISQHNIKSNVRTRFTPKIITKRIIDRNSYMRTYQQFQRWPRPLPVYPAGAKVRGNRVTFCPNLFTRDTRSRGAESHI